MEWIPSCHVILRPLLFRGRVTNAIGPQQGRKVFTLQTLLPSGDDDRFSPVAKAGGFSLHAGVATQAHQRKKLKRICRYVARPAVSEKRLVLIRDGRVCYEFKTPYRESLPRERSECFGYGTTHVIFEPLDFMARLAALVPKPRVNLTRFHGVFAPNSKYHMTITPTKSGKGAGKAATQTTEPDDLTPMEKHTSMAWARRLKRVFNIDIIECEKCQGSMKIIACINDPIVIEIILAHLKAKEGKQASYPNKLQPTRGPPWLPGMDQGLSD